MLLKFDWKPVPMMGLWQRFVVPKLSDSCSEDDLQIVHMCMKDGDFIRVRELSEQQYQEIIHVYGVRVYGVNYGNYTNVKKYDMCLVAINGKLCHTMLYKNCKYKMHYNDLFVPLNCYISCFGRG